MTYKEALDYIHSRPRFKNTDNRKAMRLLLEQLDNPQDKLQIIHIAGTNGKGSCAKMLSNIFIEAGYKTGLNISPFIIDFRERFTVNGEFISEEKLVAITEIVKEKQEYIFEKYNCDLVEFEVVTAIAFYYFYIEKCDIVCLEVGIGGKEDSTNVIKNSLISCIMNISFDHTEILGETIEEIAYQKAGIIKENQSVICYPAMDERALKVIEKECNEKKSSIIIPNIEDININHIGQFNYILNYKEFSIKQSFAGIHQSYNTTVVIETAKILNNTTNFVISNDNITKGIEITTFPARIEIFSKNPLIILDGGHNIDGVTALAKVLKENNVDKLTAIWASLSDKQPEKIIKIMAPFMNKLYTADIFGSRALSKYELADIAKQYVLDTKPLDTIECAIKNAIDNKENLIVFGSLYLASDARKFILKNVDKQS